MNKVYQNGRLLELCNATRAQQLREQKKNVIIVKGK